MKSFYRLLYVQKCVRMCVVIALKREQVVDKVLMKLFVFLATSIISFCISAIEGMAAIMMMRRMRKKKLLVEKMMV